jgi:hypothetical protein
MWSNFLFEEFGELEIWGKGKIKWIFSFRKFGIFGIEIIALQV